MSVFNEKPINEKDINPFTGKLKREVKKRLVHEWIAEITERNKQRRQQKQKKYNPFLRKNGAADPPPSGLPQIIPKD